MCARIYVEVHVCINFLDIEVFKWSMFFFCNREKMVAALLASGAFAGAVTDPTSQDRTGRTPAFIAASNGHKGLAGYLSRCHSPAIFHPSHWKKASFPKALLRLKQK